MTQTINTAAPAYLDQSTNVLTDVEAWVALQTVVVSGSSTSTITLQSSTGANDWSQYQDLVLLSAARGDTASSADPTRLNLNNDTGGNYTYMYVYSNGTSAAASNSATATYWWSDDATGASAASGLFGSGILHIFDINSGKYKHALCQTDRAGNQTIMYSYTWENQAAITEIDLTNGGNFVADSRFDLFGVLPRMVS